MANVAVLLAPGFEEAEAIITIDILRRLQIEVETLACAASRAVVSYHNIPMVADSTLTERINTLYDAVVLPGGRRAASILRLTRRCSALFPPMTSRANSSARSALRPRGAGR